MLLSEESGGGINEIIIPLYTMSGTYKSRSLLHLGIRKVDFPSPNPPCTGPDEADFISTAPPLS